MTSKSLVGHFLPTLSLAIFFIAETPCNVEDSNAGGGYEDLLALFADWRAVTTVDWNMDRWSANLAFRWMDDMILEYGSKLDSAMFTDLQVRYNPEFMDDALTVAIGFNNLFDEDPPVCNPCGVIGLSTVSHDLPGTVGYIRVTYQQN